MTVPIWHLKLVGDRVLVGKLTGVSDDTVLCFSMIAPVQVLSGCKKIRGVAGYTEILVNDNQEFSIAFESDDFKIFNKGWLPVNPYIRDKNKAPIDVEIKFNMPIEHPTINPVTNLSKGLRLVPAPQNWQKTQHFLTADGGFQLPLESEHTDALIAVNALAIRNNFGAFLGGTIPCRIEIDPSVAREGYHLDIQPESVTITAATRTGVLYAGISLLTLNENHGGKIPCGKITDSPRFEWRGQQIDCARHFFQPETLMELLDLMALLKLNKFHWHFNDDEAFRLEVTCYPEIWQKTALRGEGQLIPAVFGGQKEPTGGSYSLDFAKSLIARAAELEIDVLPEIEIPAHSYALTRIFPQLRDPADNTEEPSIQGYKANTMNPAMPFMWEFIENLTREIASIFPFAHIHLGCDERPPEAWKNSPKAKALMAEQGLETLDDLQGWTIAKAAKIVRDLGCQPCAWEEAVKGSNGGIGNDAILFSWTGQGPGLAAARAGYRVVMCPAQNLYFDMAISERFEDSGGRWAGTVTLEDTIDWQPVPNDEPELEAHVIGVEGAFWSEFTRHDDFMKPMIAPRILGVSEMGWRMADNAPTKESINQSATDFANILDKLHWNTG
ncbi:MAG: family 20 glycosylhydrolase [Rhodobacteraceae bacterium]|nr:family 20 glycosylhydrolase [Paracoccaceae bacterium]